MQAKPAAAAAQPQAAQPASAPAKPAAAPAPVSGSRFVRRAPRKQK